MKGSTHGIVSLIFIFFAAFSGEGQKAYPVIQNNSFSTGEILDYHATFW